MEKDDKLTSADIPVMSADWATVVAAYILPEVSDWGPFTDTSPYDKLMELLTVLGEDEKPVLILGDLNARTGVNSSQPSLLRASADALSSPSPRGNSLLRVCRSERMTIFNGLPQFGD